MNKEKKTKRWLTLMSLGLCLILFGKRLTGEIPHILLGFLLSAVIVVHICRNAKLLAIIRHKVFAVLRNLCPARLEGKDKGNLISLITSDIELLEVFYAHTISPIAIAFFTSAVMVWFIGSIQPMAGVIALTAYLIIGVVIPLWNGRRGAEDGMEYRNAFGGLNSFLLDSLRGLDEIIQYGQNEIRLEQMKKREKQLSGLRRKQNRYEAGQNALTNLVILLFSLGMLLFMLFSFRKGVVSYGDVVIATIALMGSFGPVVALSNLSNHLNQTLASGERVLSLLVEEPAVAEVSGRNETVFEGAKVEQINFSYGKEEILENYSLDIDKGKVIGIHGASGSGKSTLLKLLMRFWDADGGNVMISEKDIKKINTEDLRNMESYVTQETYLFHDSIANNIAIGKTRCASGRDYGGSKKGFHS